MVGNGFIRGEQIGGVEGLEPSDFGWGDLVEDRAWDLD
jgi:hypothetical protein